MGGSPKLSYEDATNVIPGEVCNPVPWIITSTDEGHQEDSEVPLSQS